MSINNQANRDVVKNLLFLCLIFSQISFSKNNQLNDLVEIKEIASMVGPHPKAISRLISYVKKENSLPMMNRLLLYGPPGTGKSKYAEEIAKTLNCNFYKVSASDFINKYVGAGAANVKECFSAALWGGEGFMWRYNPNLPTVLFIDEIDVISSKSDESGEYKQTSAALWTQLDAIKGNVNIYVIMATNKREAIPATILNRLGANQIEVDLPNEEKRSKLFELYLQDCEHLKKVFKCLVKKSKGMSSRAIEDACLQSVNSARLDEVELTKDMIIDHLEKIKNPSDMNFAKRLLNKIIENKEGIKFTTSLVNLSCEIQKAIITILSMRSVTKLTTIRL